MNEVDKLTAEQCSGQDEKPQVEVVDLHHDEPEAAPAVDVNAVGMDAVDVDTVDVDAVDSPDTVLTDDEMAQATQAELLAQNRELMGWINQLEQALADCQSDFKAHIQQFQQQEDMLEARTAELLAAQGNNSNLTRDIEAAQKKSQRQAILVETVTAQLEASQERIAQMERECTLAQRRCADQAQQLLQAESLCRDLKSRLNRQQRHTLQFKAALEKSLEVSVSPANFDLPDLDVEPMGQGDDFFPRPKPVKPWSQQWDEEELAELLNAQGQDEDTEIVLDNVEPVFDPNAAKDLEATLQTDVAAWSDSEVESSERSQEAAPARVSFVPPIVPTAPIPSPAGLAATSQSSPQSSPTEATTEPVSDAELPDSELPDSELPDSGAVAVETAGGDAADVADAAVEQLQELAQVKAVNSHAEALAVASAIAAQALSASGSKPARPDVEDESPESDAEDSIPGSASSDDFDPASKANWPAPLVNPLRPSKKIGSLAAIDLPSFPKAQV